MSGAARDRWRGRSIGLVLQQPHLIPGLSVAGNLEAARYCAGLPKDPKKVREVLGALGVESFARRPVHALSQGQAQRVAVARAVVNRPMLILADEPTASLDDEHAQAVYHLLEESAGRTEATLVVVTHDQRLRDLIPNHLALSGASGGTWKGEPWEGGSQGTASGRHAGFRVGTGRGR
jgi:ABC-type lipoprotein export system ATPase subunit